MSAHPFISDGKGKFYLAFQTELVSGYLQVPIPKVEPVLRWHGPKIDLEKEWYPATFFMYEHQRHEVVLRLFCSADKQSIQIRPFTQIYGTGMSVKESPTKEDYEEIAALGLTDIGTVHSHCITKAFASGIDAKDEAEWPGGLHLTVGELDEKQYDLHARFAWDVPGQELEGKVVRKSERTLQTPALADWFKIPAYAEEFLLNEPQLTESIIGYLLTKPIEAPYPDWWEDKLLVPPPPPPMKWEKQQSAIDFNPWGGGGYPIGMAEGADIEPPPTPKEIKQRARRRTQQS